MRGLLLAHNAGAGPCTRVSGVGVGERQTMSLAGRMCPPMLVHKGKGALRGQQGEEVKGEDQSRPKEQGVEDGGRAWRLGRGQGGSRPYQARLIKEPIDLGYLSVDLRARRQSPMQSIPVQTHATTCKWPLRCGTRVTFQPYLGLQTPSSCRRVAAPQWKRGLRGTGGMGKLDIYSDIYHHIHAKYMHMAHRLDSDDCVR